MNDESSLLEEIDKVSATESVKVLKQNTLVSFWKKIILLIIILAFCYSVFFLFVALYCVL